MQRPAIWLAASLLAGSPALAQQAHASTVTTAVVAAVGAGPAKAGSSPRPDTPGKQGSTRARPRPDQKDIGRQASDEARARAKRQRSKVRRGKPRRSGAVDDARLPAFGHPTVQRTPVDEVGPLLGWSASLDQPRFSDRRRRLPPYPSPSDYGHSLREGERVVFDVYFAGNPAGLAEAWVESVEPDPRGDPPHGSPIVRLDGKATTSGVVSVLATVTDHMYSIVDGETGASIKNVNVVTRAGLMAEYKKRVTTIDFEGRGHIRIVDDKDGKVRKKTTHIPTDTLDPLGAMAWVRSLNLQEGETAVAHALDGKVLLRVEVVGRGVDDPDPMPSIAAGLGIKKGDVNLVEGTATRVDRYDVPIPDKRPYTFRAWVSNDGRGILLALESDMWLGVIRLVLSKYDAPRDAASPAPASETDQPAQGPDS